MYEVIYMKADYEPWWLFDGWEKEIISRHSFEQENEAMGFLNEILLKLENKFQHMNSKENCFFAFWSDNEKVFCEACDDDLQTFHGILILNNGIPFKEANH